MHLTSSSAVTTVRGTSHTSTSTTTSSGRRLKAELLHALTVCLVCVDAGCSLSRRAVKVLAALLLMLVLLSEEKRWRGLGSSWLSLLPLILMMPLFFLVVVVSYPGDHDGPIVAI